MLKNRMWYCYWDALDTELRQCRDEGKEIPSELEEEVRELEKVTRGPFTEEEYDRVMALIDRLEALPEPEVPVWQEPSDREGIRALSQPRRVAIPYDEAAIENKVHGAWIGRVTGCLIGKPVEGRNREYIRKLAEAAVSSDMHHIVETGLSVIPSTSRLWRDVKKILALYDAGISYEDTVEAIHQQYPMNTLHNSVHTNPNAMIVATALLYGEGDYARTLGMSIMPGMDTDCNGATVGSVIGMVTGADRIPAHFTDPICDTLCTDIVGNARVSISDMAKRTMKFIPAK